MNRKTLPKTLTAILAMSLALILTACGEDEKGSASTNDNSSVSSEENIGNSNTANSADSSSPAGGDSSSEVEDGSADDNNSSAESETNNADFDGVFRVEVVNNDTVKVYLTHAEVSTMYCADNGDVANNITIFFERSGEEIARLAVHAQGIVGTYYKADHAILYDDSKTKFPNNAVCWTLEYSGIANEIKSCDSIGIYYSNLIDGEGSHQILYVTNAGEIASAFGNGIGNGEIGGGHEQSDDSSSQSSDSSSANSSSSSSDHSSVPDITDPTIADLDFTGIYALAGDENEPYFFIEKSREYYNFKFFSGYHFSDNKVIYENDSKYYDWAANVFGQFSYFGFDTLFCELDGTVPELQEGICEHTVEFNADGSIDFTVFYGAESKSGKFVKIGEFPTE